MEIKIRNLDCHVVCKIDDMAHHVGLSRNEFLREKIMQIAASPELFKKDEQYGRLINECKKTIENNTKLLEALMEEYE